MPKRTTISKKPGRIEAFGEEIHSSNLKELTATLERKMQEKHRETQTKLRKSEMEAKNVILNTLPLLASLTALKQVS